MLQFSTMPAAAHAIKSSHFHLISTLRLFSDRHGTSCPGLRKLAELTGMSLSKVQREIAEMASLGYIAIQKRFKRSTVYRIAQRFLVALKNPADGSGRVRRGRPTGPVTDVTEATELSPTGGTETVSVSPETVPTSGTEAEEADFKEEPPEAPPTGGRALPDVYNRCSRGARRRDPDASPRPTPRPAQVLPANP
jgi:DNA-binding transcriptional MocR family regulator